MKIRTNKLDGRDYHGQDDHPGKPQGAKTVRKESLSQQRQFLLFRIQGKHDVPQKPSHDTAAVAGYFRRFSKQKREGRNRRKQNHHGLFHAIQDQFPDSRGLDLFQYVGAE